nr:Peptidase M12A domain containing protein [Haemonchus contortus]
MISKQSRYVALVFMLMLILDGGLALTDSARASLMKDLIETNKASFPGGGSIVEKNRIAGISDYLYEGEPKKALVKKALAYLTARTCVTFVENATAMHRIRVFSGEGCNSFVGMVGGEQDLSLGEGCDTMGIVAHEFIHALGVYHMQSRHDRDSFITADLTNVPDESKQNYIKLTTMNSINYTPYEYGSVMHYDAQSFATTGTSMKAKNAKYLRTMGSHMISFYDISIINTLYNCNVPPMRTLVNKTLAYLSARTCLTFVEDATATNRVRVIEGDGCYSSVGMIGGEQDLSLGCGTAADQPNYNKLTTDESVNYTPYEYGSVMHYDAKAEMISKQSRFVALVSLLMLLLEGGFALTNSGRASLAQKAVKTNKASFPEGGSIVDKNRIAGISDYLYDGDINLTEGDGCYSYVGMIGGVQDLSLADGCGTMGIIAHEFMHALGIFHMQSRHDRDSFITLDLTNVPPAGCGAVLTATAAWKAKKVVLGNATNPYLRETYAMCNDWIKAPAGKKVQVQVTVLKGVVCINGCYAQGIEFKTLASKVITNPREMISKQSRFVALVSLLMLLLEGGLALTNSGRASLAQTLRGVDPEQRRERLRNLQLVDVVSSPAGATTITDEDKEVKTNKASFPEGGSIVDKNRIAGISDYLYDGDINLTEEQLSALESELSSGTTRQKRQASKIYATWTDKKVFYYFDESLGEPMRALVRKTHAYLTARTCVTFVENATATNRVRVFRGDGCYSYVGMIGGVQDLSLADGCGTMGIIAHEFMHALGIFHMQSRHDRDSFITLDLTNVPEEMKHNYNKLTTNESVNYTPYEYGSVMHYDAQSFATSGTSMKPKNAKYLRTMGSHIISFHDINIINTHYKCNGQLKQVITSTLNPTPVINYNAYQQTEVTYNYRYI